MNIQEGAREILRSEINRAEKLAQLRALGPAIIGERRKGLIQ
jgi:hypothetical protein